MESNLLAYLVVEMIPESAQEEDQHESQGVKNQQLVQDESHTSNPIDNVPCEREEVVLSDTCIRCGDCDKEKKNEIKYKYEIRSLYISQKSVKN